MIISTKRMNVQQTLTRPSYSTSQQIPPSDQVTLGAGDAAEGVVAGGFAGAATLGTIGAWVGEPAGIVAGVFYGANNEITGNKIADVIVGGIVGAVAGPVALGVGGAVVGGVGGAVLGGLAGAFA